MELISYFFLVESTNTHVQIGEVPCIWRSSVFNPATVRFLLPFVSCFCAYDNINDTFSSSFRLSIHLVGFSSMDRKALYSQSTFPKCTPPSDHSGAPYLLKSVFYKSISEMPKTNGIMTGWKHGIENWVS